jgi:hypothetical protein
MKGSKFILVQLIVFFLYLFCCFSIRENGDSNVILISTLIYLPYFFMFICLNTLKTFLILKYAKSIFIAVFLESLIWFLFLIPTLFFSGNLILYNWKLSIWEILIAVLLFFTLNLIKGILNRNK